VPIDPNVPEWRVLRGALDAAAQKRLRDAVTDDMFALADIGYATGARVATDVRNNDRATLVSPELAAWLFEIVGPALPRVVGERRIVGLAPRIRFYRYRPGQRFAPHRDGIERGEDGASSLLTVLVSLKRAEKGGETRFIRSNATIALGEGDVLWFQHALLHEGRPVEEGEKLLARTDALFEIAR
jgi:hypothetical protein